MENIKIKKELLKEEALEKLNQYNKEESNKTFFASAGFQHENTEVVYITKDEIEKGPYFVLDKIYSAKDNGLFINVQTNPRDEDIRFLNFLLRDRRSNNKRGTFFKNKSSRHLRLVTPEEFLNEVQFSDSYFMDVSLKDVYTRRETATSKDIYDKETGSYKQNAKAYSYVKTDRSNIFSVGSLLIDIDFHEENMSEKELDLLADGILFFAMQEGAYYTPTAIVNSGRGLQLHFVLEERLFRHGADKNQRNIDKMLRLSHQALMDKYDNIILPNLPYDDLKCDRNINAINQKRRVPGTLNFKSGTYAKVVHFNESQVIMLGDMLNDYYGEYSEFLEAQKSWEKETTKRRNKTGNNGNGRGNISIVLEKRIADFEKAMIEVSNFESSGWRNNAYFSLAVQYINLKKYNNMSFKSIAAELERIDSQLQKPYFTKGFDKIESFVMSADESYNNFNSQFLTNDSIEEYTTVLQLAYNNGVELEFFFKETITEKRNKLLKANKEKRNKRIQETKRLVLQNYNIQDISNKLDITRNTVYQYLKEILGKTGSSLKGLLKEVKNFLVKDKLKEVLQLKRASKKMLASAITKWNKISKGSVSHLSQIISGSKDILLFDTGKSNRFEKIPI